MNESLKRKLLRAACHAAALCNWTLVILGVPIGALLLSDDPLVRDSAKEALNFTFTMFVAGAVCVGLMFTIIGIPAAVIGLSLFGVVNTIFPLVAIVSVCLSPEKPFHYPLTIQFFKTEEQRLLHSA